MAISGEIGVMKCCSRAHAYDEAAAKIAWEKFPKFAE
jgi:hypothetical protein